MIYGNSSLSEEVFCKLVVVVLSYSRACYNNYDIRLVYSSPDTRCRDNYLHPSSCLCTLYERSVKIYTVKP